MEDLDLSSFFTTKPQAIDFSTRLATISQELYHTNFSLEKSLMEQFGMQKKDKFITVLRENKIHTESNSDLVTFFTAIQEKISLLPVLSLTIAFEPEEQTLKRISEWFVLTMHKQVLFEILVDPTLIGGAAITFNGKYKDCSIRSIFKRVLKDASSEKIQKPIPQDTSTPIPDQGAHQTIEHVSIGK